MFVRRAADPQLEPQRHERIRDGRKPQIHRRADMMDRQSNRREDGYPENDRI